MKANPFEKSKKDKEPKGMKEGSKREEAMDKKQAMPFKKGGMVGPKGPAKAFAAPPMPMQPGAGGMAGMGAPAGMKKGGMVKSKRGC
jgi:hypothetical protein